MRIASLHTYPVKGAHRLDHDRAVVEPWGLAGDRRWMVIDPDGVGITQRDTPALTRLHASVEPGKIVLTASGSSLSLAEPVDGAPVSVRVFSSKTPVPALTAPAGEWLTAFLGRPARLAWLGDPAAARPVESHALDTDRVSFADGFPLLLANTASLTALGDWLYEDGDEPVPMTRFRPNVVVDGAAPWAEDDWLGRRLSFGDVTFRAAKSCARCVVTTIDQESGEKGRQPLRILGRHRRSGDGLLFGINLIPDHLGVIQVGDEMRVEP